MEVRQRGVIKRETGVFQTHPWDLESFRHKAKSAIRGAESHMLQRLSRTAFKAISKSLAGHHRTTNGFMTFFCGSH